MLSHNASIWFVMKRNKSHLKHLRHPELLATSTWPLKPVEKTSTWESEFIHGTLSESTRCFHALVQIDSSKVWEVLSVKVSLKLAESALDKSSCPSELDQSIFHKPKKPWEEQSSSSQADRRFSSQESSVSPISLEPISTSSKKKERSSQMVLVLKSLPITDLLPDFLSSKTNDHFRDNLN